MSDLFVYLIRSRNKDNKDVPDFKERAKTILQYKDKEDLVVKEFERFAANGVPGEKTRLYRSVNSRDEDKIRDELIIRLIRDKPSMTSLNRVLASVAQQNTSRDESKWLFDFDYKDKDLLNQFLSDVRTVSDTFPTVYPTPNGFAVIVEHGFDTRELMDKWKDYDITLKRDELLFLDMKENIND